MGDLAERKEEVGSVTTFERKFSTNQVKLIREIVAPNLEKVVNDEKRELYFQMFMNYAKRTGLDPMAKQLYALMIQDRFVIHTGIGGLRATASRTKEYLGKTKPLFKGQVNLKFEQKEYVAPHSCEMEVYRLVQGQKAVFPTICYWDEFYPGPRGYKWRTGPHLMLAKCTEAQCLKMGFEIELAGIELSDNIERIESEEAKQGADFIRRFMATIPENITTLLDSEEVAHKDRIALYRSLSFNLPEIEKAFTFLREIKDKDMIIKLTDIGLIKSIQSAKKAEYDLEKLTAALEPFKEEEKRNESGN